MPIAGLVRRWPDPVCWLHGQIDSSLASVHDQQIVDIFASQQRHFILYRVLSLLDSGHFWSIEMRLESIDFGSVGNKSVSDYTILVLLAIRFCVVRN